MSSKITGTGIQLNGTGTTEQTKVVVSVDGNVPNTSGEITLSSTSQSLDTRVSDLELNGTGGGGGPTMLSEEDSRAGTCFLIAGGARGSFKLNYGSSPELTWIESNVQKGDYLNLYQDTTTDKGLVIVSEIDKVNNTIQLIFAESLDSTYSLITTSSFSLRDINDVVRATGLTWNSGVSNHTNNTTHQKWMQVVAGEDNSLYSSWDTISVNGVHKMPINLSSIPSDATHIIFLVKNSSVGSGNIYLRYNFDTFSSSESVINDELFIVNDSEGSGGSQITSGTYIVPVGSYLYESNSSGGRWYNFKPIGYITSTGEDSSGGSGGSLKTLSTYNIGSGDTLINFSGFDQYAERITIVFDKVQFTNQGAGLIQIGDSGGFEETGYINTITEADGSSGSASNSAGFPFTQNTGTSAELSGQIELTNLDGTNTWLLSGQLMALDSGSTIVMTGTKTLSDSLDRLRINANTLGSFTGGSIGVQYLDKNPIQNNIITTAYYDASKVGVSAPNSDIEIWKGVAPLFENFKVDFANAHKLCIYAGDFYSEVLISDLIEKNPSSSAKYWIQWDDSTTQDGGTYLYFIGNDLSIFQDYTSNGSNASNAHYYIYRVDIHQNQGSTAEVYTKTEVDSLITSSGGGLILVPPMTLELDITVCPQIGTSGFYELDYDDFGSSGQLVPDRAIIYGSVQVGYNSGSAAIFEFCGYDLKIGTPVTTSQYDTLRAHKSVSGIDSNTFYFIPWWPSTSPWTGTYGLTSANPRKLAIKWTAGTSYITLLGYMMPNYTD